MTVLVLGNTWSGRMTREKYSEELKANIIISWKKRKIHKAKIARKFGISDSGARQFMDDYRDEVKSDGFRALKGFDSEFQKIEMPDEELQNKKAKIAFYLAEAEKYKKLAKKLEKKEKILLNEKKLFFTKQVEKCIENHELTEIDGKWKMSHEEFLEFFDELTMR